MTSLKQVTGRAEALEGDNTYYDLFKVNRLDVMFETVHRYIDEDNREF
jgi:hypothetical protein